MRSIPIDAAEVGANGIADAEPVASSRPAAAAAIVRWYVFIGPSLKGISEINTTRKQPIQLQANGGWN
jgi:hypothetical protein